MTLMTPGVFIDESNAFPNSVVAVDTSVPAFIGYTETAVRNGESLIGKTVRITSFEEYTDFFGKGFNARYSVEDAKNTDQDSFEINGSKKVLKVIANNTFYLYNSIRLFYANGGGTAYIISVGTYGDKPDGMEINVADFIGSDTAQSPIEQLTNEQAPSMIVIPDAVALGEKCYSSVYTAVLQHCAKTKRRFGIFDLVKKPVDATTDEIIGNFRNKIGQDGLSYGAAYYPWLKTNVVSAGEISFENLIAGVDLERLLPEETGKEIVKKFNAIERPTANDKKDYHVKLKESSSIYMQLLNEVLNKQNELPPSGAIAGIYTTVDSSRGVWKSPANVSIGMANAPTINLSNVEQEQLNIDPVGGKSINIIRAFPGVGTLVWGGRTLDGNSMHWRYIHVRRTLIMIEQSIQLACRAYTFERNDTTTWTSVKSMIGNFLYNLWQQGAFMGAASEDAYDVSVGLGLTMTAGDILEGKMVIVVKVAIVRPAEFIAITIIQQMQAG